jgi:ubiquinone/menaquinone biosynthesis C-methylase UbiE
MADIGTEIPMASHSVDVCLMSTVLHDLIQDDTYKTALKEVRRLIKPEGIFAIIEFKKIEGPPGPPIHVRITSEDVIGILNPYGFHMKTNAEIGPFHYLSMFSQRK